MDIIGVVKDVKRGFSFPFKNLGPSKSPPKNFREKAKKSIQSCDFERLKKLEIKDGFSESPISKKNNSRINFFKLGKDNDYKKLLTEDLISKMNLKFKDEINKYNYE